MTGTQAAMPAGLLRIVTMRFGEPESVDVPPAALYTFPEAMPGLEDSHRFALIGDENTAPFRWLQSLDEQHVCLPVLGLDVLQLEDYAPAVANTDEAEGAAQTGRILLVCRFDRDAGVFLTNLLAPIVLDARAGIGKQVILEGQSYPMRQPLRWDTAARIFEPC